MWKLSVISGLMKKDLSIDQINNIWYKNINYHENNSDDLNNFASRVVTKNGTKFHLKDISGWHPLLPFLELFSINTLVQKFIDKNPDALINFHSIPDDSIHLNTLIVTSQNCEQYYKDKNNQESKLSFQKV